MCQIHLGKMCSIKTTFSCCSHCYRRSAVWCPTFPHGESQDGSPGLDAFHKAKSFWDFFSLSLSAEILRSPAGWSYIKGESAVHVEAAVSEMRPINTLTIMVSIKTIMLTFYLLPPVKLSGLLQPLAPVWHTSALNWYRTWKCRSRLNHWTRTWRNEEANVTSTNPDSLCGKFVFFPSSPITIRDDLLHKVHNLWHVLTDPGQDIRGQNLGERNH